MVLFFSRPRSEGWPHHERTFSIYLCPLPFWLTLPWWVLSTSWCYSSRLCMAFFACVHLALFLALQVFLSPGYSLVSSSCDHSMLASLLWQSLIVPFLLIQIVVADLSRVIEPKYWRSLPVRSSINPFTDVLQATGRRTYFRRMKSANLAVWLTSHMRHWYIRAQ